LYWLRIEVEVPEFFREAVSNVFLELGSGVEEPASCRLGVALVRGYWLQDDQINQVLEELRHRLHHLLGAPALIKIRRFKEEDWSVSWRKGYKPVRVGDRLVIKPSWVEFQKQPRDLVIEMDPGLAFGCGTHPTTVMCLRMLERCVRSGMVVADVVTGTGVLAIASLFLGASRVWAVDEDPVAVRTATENLALNRLAGRVEVRRGNLLDGFSQTVDLVVANILAEVLVQLCPQAAQVLKPGGQFILGGIVMPKEEQVKRALVNNGFRVATRLADGEWVTLLGVKT